MHAGSDVVEAFTYYAHREKLRLIGQEALLEPLNRQALAIAGDVARETGALFAGDICNTNVFLEDPATRRRRPAMFEEQVRWAAEAGVDFVIAETFQFAGEAVLATEVVKRRGAGRGRDARRPPGRRDARGLDARRGLPPAGRRRRGRRRAQLHPRAGDDAAAAARRLRARPDVPVAALPVPYRTHAGEPTFQSLADPHGHGRPVPDRPGSLHLQPPDVAAFARRRSGSGSRYLGLCCGAAPHHIRAMAEAMGRRPEASRYSPDMSKHAFLGSDPSLPAENLAYAERL